MRCIKIKIFLFICLLWPLEGFSAPPGGSKKSCSARFKQSYTLLNRGRNPSRLNGKQCPSAHKLMTWLWLLKQRRGTPFKAYEHFLRDNPHWPNLEKIQEGAEAAINRRVSASEVLKFFNNRVPVSSLGVWHYVNALFQAGKRQKALQTLRHFWRSKNFNGATEKTFYKRFKKHITIQDNLERMNRLAIDGNYYGLKRMIRRVGRSRQPIAQAAMALIRNQSSAVYFLRKLSKKQKTMEGVVFQRVKYLLKRKKREKALRLFLDFERTHPKKAFAHKWFKYRYYFSRKLFAKKRYAQAYALIKNHQLSPKNPKALTDYGAAEWFSGWVSLLFLKKPSQALKHFKAMHDHTKTPISHTKSLYWMGRTYEALKREGDALRVYQNAAQNPHVFYGQEALKKLKKSLKVGLKKSVSMKGGSQKHWELRRAVALLHKTNPKDPHLRSFLMHLAHTCPPGSRESLIQWMHHQKMHRWIVLCAKVGGKHGPILLKASYPTQKISSRILKGPLSWALLHGVVRQESGFDVGVKSPAGACGLMQLMPKTAQSTCKKMRLSYSRRRLTRDGGYNLRIGSFYLKTLLEHFDGHVILALAAYNGGLTNVKQWMKDYGDPRVRGVSDLKWIESIPFSETRTYVMRILESLPLYKTLKKG